VIAHDRTRLAAVNQVTDEIGNGPVLGPSVDEIAQEDDSALGLGVNPARDVATPTQIIERAPQLVDLPVNVWKNVDGCHEASVCLL